MESRSPCLVELPWIKLHNFCSERVWAAARVAEFPCLSAINVSSLGRKCREVGCVTRADSRYQQKPWMPSPPARGAMVALRRSRRANSTVGSGHWMMRPLAAIPDRPRAPRFAQRAIDNTQVIARK